MLLFKDKIVLAVLVATGALIFSFLGSFPQNPDVWETHSIHFALQSYLNNTSITSSEHWRWSSSLGAGTRTVGHAWLLMTGWKIVGLGWQGARLLPAMLAWLSMVLLFVTLRHAQSLRFALATITLLATGPLFLVLARSASIAGVALSSTIFLGCLIYWAFLPNAPGWWMALVGALIAIMPYLPPHGRVIAPVALLILFTRRDFFRNGRLLWAALGFGVVLIPMLPHLAYELPAYASGFNFGSFGRNCYHLLRQLLGLTGGWHTRLVKAPTVAYILLYPKELVPLFVLGTGVAVYRFARRREWKDGWMLLALLAAGFAAVTTYRGGTNGVRGVLLAVPIYGLVAYGLLALLERFPVRALAVLGVLFLLGSSEWQAHDFFTRQTVTDLRYPRQAAPLVQETLRANPGLRLQANICPNTDCQDALLLFGGDPLVSAMRSGILRLDSRAPAGLMNKDVDLLLINRTSAKAGMMIPVWGVSIAGRGLVLFRRPDVKPPGTK